MSVYYVLSVMFGFVLATMMGLWVAVREAWGAVNSDNTGEESEGSRGWRINKWVEGGKFRNG